MPTRLVSLLGLCLLTLANPALTQAQSANGVITACVARLTGVARIVAGPAGCLARLESVVQFNAQGPAGPAGPQGPAGPTGPQGPQGEPGPSNNAPFLVRTLLVRAGGTPEENGERLWEALDSAASVASDSNPYMLQLDAGTYTYSRPDGASFVVVPGVSLRGQGMNSTFITAPGATLIFRQKGAASQTSSFSVQDLTLDSAPGGGLSIGAQNIQAVVLDHVHLRGGMALYATAPAASAFITNSIFDQPIGIFDNTHDTTDRFRIVGSQLPGVQVNDTPGTLACFSSFTANLTPLNNNCQ